MRAYEVNSAIGTSISNNPGPGQVTSQSQAGPGVRLEPYNDSYRSGVLALFSSVPFKPRLWQWQFEQNPFDRPFQPVMVTDTHGRVIGFNGVMPIEVTDHGEPLDVIWSCDFYVDSSYRGAGVGSLLKQGLSDRAAIILALGVSDKASQVLAHLGWKAGTHVLSYKRIRRKWSIRNMAITVVQVINSLFGWWRMGLNRNRRCLEISAQSELPCEQEVDLLWSRVSRGYDKVITRNHRYLNWKYQLHPMARYGFVVAREQEELTGLLVVRFTNGALRIVDYCGPARDQVLKDRLAAFCNAQWSHGSYFSLTTSDPELGRSFLATGFYRSFTQTKFYVRTRPGMEKYDARNWFLMGGDSDGELLLAAKEFQKGV